VALDVVELGAAAYAQQGQAVGFLVGTDLEAGEADLGVTHATTGIIRLIAAIGGEECLVELLAEYDIFQATIDWRVTGDDQAGPFTRCLLQWTGHDNGIVGQAISVNFRAAADVQEVRRTGADHPRTRLDVQC
jgi:hypothetical protein